MKVAGLGRQRIALEISYRGKTYVLKVDMKKGANSKEYRNIQKMINKNSLVEKFITVPKWLWENDFFNQETKLYPGAYTLQGN
jgi:hypothetical protein